MHTDNSDDSKISWSGLSSHESKSRRRPVSSFNWCSKRLLVMAEDWGWFGDCCLGYSAEKKKYASSSYGEYTVSETRSRQQKRLLTRGSVMTESSPFCCLCFQIACLVPVDQFQLYQRLKFERGLCTVFFLSSWWIWFYLCHLYTNLHGRWRPLCAVNKATRVLRVCKSWIVSRWQCY